MNENAKAIKKSNNQSPVTPVTYFEVFVQLCDATEISEPAGDEGSPVSVPLPSMSTPGLRSLANLVCVEAPGWRLATSVATEFTPQIAISDLLSSFGSEQRFAVLPQDCQDVSTGASPLGALLVQDRQELREEI